jgi:hypothetical protein
MPRRRDSEEIIVNAFKAEGAIILAAELAAERLALRAAAVPGPVVSFSADEVKRLAAQLREVAGIARDYHLAAAEAA